VAPAHSVVKYSPMPKFAVKYPRSSHVGHNVSHAKNRTKRRFKYNLHTVTIMVDGTKQRLRVPTKVLRQLKKEGITTHWRLQPRDHTPAAGPRA